ncbi:MAG: VanZ family protein [Lachnospiraceae bacterium]|nr:VanZ family protein [Lachnospiraceae bacterium]
MLIYIVRDLFAVFRYLPYGLIVGIFAAILLGAWNDRRKGGGKKAFSTAAVTCFVMYAAIILCITFLSRESGSGQKLDLKLFSTWGINDRNNAYVVENILLFVPFGFIAPWAFKSFMKPHICIFAGFMTSLAIELMQLITSRGFFQIDDIITNTLGMIIGYIFFMFVYGCVFVIKSLRRRFFS